MSAGDLRFILLYLHSESVVYIHTSICKSKLLYKKATNRCDPGYEWGNVAAGEITQDGSAMKAFI